MMPESTPMTDKNWKENREFLVEIFNSNYKFFSEEFRYRWCDKRQENVEQTTFTDEQKAEEISFYLEGIEEYYEEVPERFLTELKEGKWNGETDEAGRKLTVIAEERWAEECHTELIIISRKVYEEHWKGKEFHNRVSIDTGNIEEDQVFISLGQYHLYTDKYEFMEFDELIDFYGIYGAMTEGMTHSG